MKRLMLVVVMVLCVVSLGYSELKEDGSKHKVKFILVFNELTLEQAAKKEAAIRETFKDACKLEIEVDKISESVSFLSSAPITMDNVITIPLTSN